MQRHVLFMPFPVTIRGIGVQVGVPTSVEHVHRPVALQFFAKTALTFHKPLHGIRHGHVDIQHVGHTDRSFRHSGVRANLNFGNILRFHLTQDQSHIAVHRHVVYAQVVIVNHVLIAPYHQIRHHLKHIR